MNNTGNCLRWRRFSPLDRVSPILELVDGDITLLDVTLDPQGELEIAFHEGAANREYQLAAIEELLRQAKKILREDHSE